MDDRRDAPIELDPDRFRALGHDLVERIADFLATVRERPVTREQTPEEIRAALGDGGLPEHGTPLEEFLPEVTELLFDRSLLPGHPRFWGYIVGAPAPVGALGDLLAAAVNPNLGGWPLSPVATEIEAQTVRWIAELIGYPADAGGLLVSGGNMANFVGFVAARRARAPWNVREEGVHGGHLCVYASEETHTWIQKAADLFGLGTDAIRWVPTDDRLRLDTAALRARIREDRASGLDPLLVVGAAGTVSTGAIDPLPELAAICREEGLWFHVDGAYGAPAAALPDASDDLRGLALADSLALDPHKWLYTPVEAGCALVRDRQALRAAFSYRPAYYLLDEEQINYHEYGPQNSRGFRALKVWLALRQVGREGYVRMLADDVALARDLFHAVERDDELEAATQSLSITTFRYVPGGVGSAGDEYLDRLNEEIVHRIQAGGEAFVSNAIVDGRFLLRACVVNFRTGLEDIRALPGLVKRVGAEAHAELRQQAAPR